MPARIKTSVASVVHAAPVGVDDGMATKFVSGELGYGGRPREHDQTALLAHCVGHDSAKEARGGQRRAQEKAPHDWRQPPGANRRSRF
jgi:hypothetical protein